MTAALSQKVNVYDARRAVAGRAARKPVPVSTVARGTSVAARVALSAFAGAGGVSVRTWGAAVCAAVVAMSVGAGEPVPAKTFDVVASKYEFEPSTIEVEEGDVVELRLKSADVEHGVGIKAFGVKKTIPKGGEVVTVRFTASKPGSYDMVCSEYCGKGHRGMKGKLLVKAKEQ